MKIWQVHTRYRLDGGEDTAVDNERALLSASGHEVGTHLEQNPTQGMPAAGALLLAPWNRSAAARVVEEALRFEPDVVHVHNTWFATSPAVFPALRAAKFPVVATIHNYRSSCLNAMLYRDGSPCQDCVGRVPWRGVMRQCYRDSVVESAAVAGTLMVHRLRRTWHRDIQVVVALTRFAADILVRSGVPAKLIEIKPNVASDPGSRASLPSQSDRVLFVGRLTEEKGIADLLGAWSRHPRPTLHLDVVGEGPLSGQLRAAAGVSFLGPLSSREVAEAMIGARALVVPSRWYEGQPMVVLEAMAAGLPIVVPDLGALPEIVGEGGLVFRAGDIGHLAQLSGALSDDRLVDEKGAAARAEYQARYSEAAGLRRLEEVYRLAIERAQ